MIVGPGVGALREPRARSPRYAPFIQSRNAWGLEANHSLQPLFWPVRGHLLADERETGPFPAFLRPWKRRVSDARITTDGGSLRIRQLLLDGTNRRTLQNGVDTPSSQVSERVTPMMRSGVERFVARCAARGGRLYFRFVRVNRSRNRSGRWRSQGGAGRGVYVERGRGEFAERVPTDQLASEVCAHIETSWEKLGYPLAGSLLVFQVGDTTPHEELRLHFDEHERHESPGRRWRQRTL